MKPLLNKAMMMAVIVIMSSRLLAQTIIYVDVDATGSDDGTTWANAYNDLQDALTFAATNAPLEIWVAEGTYTPGSNAADRFKLLPDVEMYGGFSGTETIREDRDFRANTTILSGSTGTNAHVIYNNYTSGSPLTNTSVLDGFRITGGFNSVNTGSGMSNFFASPIVRNCQFITNISGDGGAVYNKESEPTFINCEFYDNEAWKSGGAIYNVGTASSSYIVTFINCKIYGNKVSNSAGLATSGGAMLSGQGVITKIYNSLVYNNGCSSCSNPQGALRLGGVAFEIINTIVWGNNSGAEVFDIAQSSSVGNSIIEGGFPSGFDILDEDPMWNNPTQRDFSIDFCSPAINFGVSGVLTGITEDYNGDDRIIGFNPDIGPIEYQNGVDVTVNPETCATTADGSLTFTTVGTSSFEFSLDDGETYTSTSSVTGLLPGSYDVLIREVSSQCEIAEQYTVTSTAPITISSTVTDASCNTTADGQIAVSATASSTPVSYSLDGVNFQAGGTFSSLLPGEYEIFVKDNSGCVASSSTTVGPDPEPYNLTVADISCNGAGDGSILISATGSNAPYTYYLGSNPPDQVGDFQGLAPGTYSIVIENGTGCFSDPVSVTINEPTTLNATFTETDITCFGTNDGTIDVSIAGGTAPFQYQVNSGGFQSASSSTFTIADLTVNSYTVEIEDANGCSISSSTIDITQPSFFSYNITTTDITSCASDDATITITPSGGTAPFQYSIDGGTTYQSGNVFSNLAPGSYSVIAEDANGCTPGAGTVTLGNPFAFTVSATTTDATCFSNNDGTIAITATGGTGPYEYSLDGSTYQSSNTFSGSAGSYTYYVRDTDNGCVTQGTATVGEPTALTGTLTVNSNVSCNGGADGEITASAAGGTAPYTYTLDGTNYQSSATFSGLTAGTYFVGIKDDNGCNHSTSTVTVSEPAILSLTLSSAGDISCNGDASGSISSAVTGGTAPYNFSINGGDFDTNGDFEDLSAGTYTVVVEDANGCQDTETFDVTEPDAIVLTLSGTDATCNGDADGSITASATGGSGTFTYSIDGTNFSTATSFTSLAAGSYTIVVRDVNNCETSESITVGEPVVLGVQATVTNISCNGEADGLVVAVGSGGTSPYSYSLDGSNFQSTDTFEDLAPGAYTMTIEDANGCTTSEAFSVAEPDELTIAVTQDGRNDFTITGAGGTAPYEYSTDAINFQGEASFVDLAPGQYRFTVRDANGCMAHSTAFDVVLGIVNEEVSIYPNPVSEYLKIEGIDFEYAAILDLNGKEVLRSGDKIISIEKLSAGIHLINLYQNNRLVHQQKIKIN